MSSLQARLASGHQQQQARLADAVARLTLIQWKRLVTGPGIGTDQFLTEVGRQVRTQARQSTSLARSFYGQSRRFANPDARPYSGPDETPTPELIKTALIGSGLKFLSEGLERGDPLPEALDKAGGVASRAAARLTLAGGRTYIQRAVNTDRLVLAYYWQTREDGKAPCYWCAMLASRGKVFTRQSWPKADPRPDGKLDPEGRLKVSAHDNCACHLAPVWTQAQELPDYVQSLEDDWKRVTKDFSGDAKMRAWRSWYTAQQRLGAVELDVV